MMIKYISEFSFRKAMQSVLFRNYFYLSAYQIVNFTVPLIIVPFVISKVGVSNFGLIAFSYAFANYFNVIVDYGFNLSATQKIAINKNNHAIINSVFTTVYVSKTLLLTVSLFLYLLLTYIFPVLHTEWLLHVASFAVVVGQSIIPIWLFQGMQDMKYLAVFNAASKLLYFFSILIFIKVPGDYYLVNLLQGLSGILVGLVSLYVCYKKFGVRFVHITHKEVRTEMASGKMLFFSAIAVNVYVNSNAFILGIFASPIEVGLYSIAEKTYYALKQLNNVFSQVIFPQICMLARKSVPVLSAFLKKIFLPFIILITIVCIAFFFGSHFISAFFLKGIINSQLITLIHIFCIITLINAFNIPAFQTLLAYNEKNKYGLILITGCVLNIISNIILVKAFQSLGTVYAILITETFITTGLCYYFFIALKQKSNEIPNHL